MLNILFEKLRYLLFRSVDLIKGGAVNKQVAAIEAINASYPASKPLVQQSLDRLLSFATATAAYYKPYSNKAITDFPVINKSVIRENFDRFVSSEYSIGQLVKVVTSGSTGTPFMLYHDKKKRLRNTADTMVFSKKAGFQLGHRLYYFKIWNTINQKSTFVNWSQNIVPYNVFDLSDEAIAALIRKLNNDPSTIGFLAYASAYDAFCRYLVHNNCEPVKANVRSVIAMSESLNDFSKENMKKYFGTVCVSRYSNVENGIIAQQEMDGSHEYSLNFASYYTEILNLHNDTVCEYGTPGRVVITDLYNYAMPMIRYDTGDIGVMVEKKINGQLVPVLEKIEGRRMDMVFSTTGGLVSSFTITNTMWKYTELKQYQFIQTGQKDYLFRLNCDGAFEKEKQLVKEFEDYFGADAKITVEYVDEIPLLDSGKRKKVMNTYKA
jgi:phenylacetate-CoA ligase